MYANSAIYVPVLSLPAARDSVCEGDVFIVSLQLEPLPKELGERVLRHTAMVLTQNKELFLTQTRDRSEPCTPLQSPSGDRNPQEKEDELVDLSESGLCSPSYRLLCFLRQLMDALKRLGGLS